MLICYFSLLFGRSQTHIFLRHSFSFHSGYYRWLRFGGSLKRPAFRAGKCYGRGSIYYNNNCNGYQCWHAVYSVYVHTKSCPCLRKIERFRHRTFLPLSYIYTHSRTRKFKIYRQTTFINPHCLCNLTERFYRIRNGQDLSLRFQYNIVIVTFS